MPLVSIIVVLVVVGVALYCLRLIPMAAPMPQIVTALVILCTVLWLLEVLGVLGNTGGHHFRL